ncbi:unnamed protein product, partial [Polarella glacialis]
VLFSLETAGVEVHPYAEIDAALLTSKGCKVWMDPKQTNFALYLAVGQGGPHVSLPSPLASMKACKNSSELEGMRSAHRRDAAALCSALAHLEALVQGGGTLTEVDVDVEVTRRRAAQWGYMDNSFDTITGYGANGAIVHYRAKREQAATLGLSAPLLLDSGA